MKKIISFILTLVLVMSICGTAFAATTSASQITDSGGTQNGPTEDHVSISKTIAGTDIENVFDITLKVTTQTDVSEITKDPDVAVVIVTDISNSMDATFGNMTRYEAAIQASNAFVNRFRSNVGAKSDTSKIGFVAFNSNSTQIAPMTEVKTNTQATNFKNTIKTGCDRIIYASDYANSHTRFTNIESGLKRGYNMIKNLPNQNKFILFLSDGFPTTYIKSGSTYDGCDPYTPGATSYSEGVFYDGYYKTPCSYGTSYSDRAAVKAREMATTIKNAGVTIFSVGVDVGSQTILGYDTHPASDGFSVIDRPKSARDNNKYEIGTNNSGFTNWLKGSATNNSVGIGSGYYYDSTNAQALANAYIAIFGEMQTITEERSAKLWHVTDPMGTNLEFIGFYDENGTLKLNSSANPTNISGSFGAAKENTATYNTSTKTFDWNLQKSGYTLSSGVYTFTLKYRVRLQNENTSGFVESTSYATNGTTQLTYNVYTTSGGTTSISAQKTLNAKIPKVKGYLSELTFDKVDQFGRPVQGAKFTLKHDTTNCNKCKGNGKTIGTGGNLGNKEATSNAAGKVTFSKIPSGHTYVLEETAAPTGYSRDATKYTVTVAYDVLTTNLKDKKVVDPMDEYDITLLKVDTTNMAKPLADAQFEVYSNAAMTTLANHPDGTVFGTLTSGVDGKLSMGVVDLNKTYYLKETSAPDGYTMLANALTITVNPANANPITAQCGSSNYTVTREGTTLNFTVKVPNNPGVELPATGGTGTLPYTLSGLILVIFALMYGFRMRRRERRLN